MSNGSSWDGTDTLPSGDRNDRVRPPPPTEEARPRYAPTVLSAGLIFLAVIIVFALVVTGVGIFLRMWQLRRR